MVSLRRLMLAGALNLLLVLTTSAQVISTDKRVLPLTNFDTRAAAIPVGAVSTPIQFTVDPGGSGSDFFDVVSSHPQAVISLILPGGAEINAGNAEAQGFSFDVITIGDEEESLTAPIFQLPGTHTVIGLPASSPPGTYQIKIDGSNVTGDHAVVASYYSSSPVRVGAVTDAATYRVGDTVIVSAVVFNDSTPVTGATVTASIGDVSQSALPPVSVVLQDSGQYDEATGDGIYTGSFTAGNAGDFTAQVRATGTSSGLSYSRTSSTTFRVLTSLANFISFSDAGVDDNGNSLLDRVVVTATVNVQTAGTYRFTLDLSSSNGATINASTSSSLAQGTQQISVSFPSNSVRSLGVDGPYNRKRATLYAEDDAEKPITAFIEDAGATSAYLLSSLERAAIQFTGNNTVTGIDTNANGKFDVLRIEAEVNVLAGGLHNWNGTLRDSFGKGIEIVGSSAELTAGVNVITFNFNGIKIAQNGKPGPFTLSSVMLYSSQASGVADELVKTQAFPVSNFECSDAVPPSIQSVSLTPATVIGGNSTRLRVNITEPAGTCGAKVLISSDNPAAIAAVIPTDVIVPAGQNFTEVNLITAGVAATTPVVITATSGATSQSATLTVNPSSLANLTLSFPAVQAGMSTAAKVELDGAAPLGGTTISLSSGNAGVATVPASAVIPAGQRSVEFTVNTNPSLQTTTAVNINATLGAVTKVAALNVFAETYVNGSITPDGPPLTVTATEAGQNFLLTFDGTAGQRVSLKLTDVNIGSSCCGAHISIKKPDGTYLVNPVYFGTAGGFVDAVSLPVAGTYTIVVDPEAANTGHVTLTLFDVPADFTTTITPGGAAVTATTTVPGQNAQLTFAGTTGQRVSLKVSSVSMTGGSNYVEVSIKNPDGSVLTSANFVTAAGTFIDVQTLASNGTYTVYVNPSDSSTGSATLTLYNVPADVTGNVTLGTPFIETTTVPGQNALLSFNGTTGQRVTINIGGVTLTGGSGYVDVTLRKPDGTTLASANFVNSGGAFINTQTLPATGVYTILVNPLDSSTGSATLTVNDVSADVLDTIAIGGNAVTVTTTSAGQNALVSFDGNAGQRVSLKISGVSLSGGNGYVDVSIKKPDGTVLVLSNFINSSGGFIDVTTLPVTGTYTILVDPQGSNIGSVTLTLYNVPADTTGSITAGGAAVTVTTTVPGQNATLTFSGSSGQRVALILTNSTYSGCLAVNDAIKKPDGTSLVSTNLCSASGFMDTVVLPVSGTYTILINPFGATIGSQTLTLIDVPEDVVTSITPGGSPVAVATTTAGQRALATFSGTANQRVSLKVSDATITGGSSNFIGVSIQKPDGSTLTSSTFASSGGFIDVQTLPVTGTYVVVVDPWDTAIANVTLTLYDVPADNLVSITPGGGPVTLTNTVPGQNAQATFTATANQRVSLNINSISLTGGSQNWATISIVAPNGSTLTWNTYATGSAGFLDTLVLASAGTYTILINPWDTATGTVTVTLNDVPADATGTLTVGGPSLSLTTTVPGQNAVPIFGGTTGQPVSIGFTNNTMGTVTVTLLKPDGTSLTSTISNSSSFSLPTQTLPTTGTYSIKIDPSGASVGSITVAVNEVTSGGTLQADYQFQNTRNSSVGTAAALADLGTNSFTSAVVDGTSTTVLTFSQGDGVSLTPTSGVVPNDNYTIVMLFSLQTTSGYRRLIDFKNAASDNGLYVQSGRLNFYPSAAGTPVSIPANTWVQVVLTRDQTGTVTGYVDGVQQFQFSDTSSHGVISSNTLRFFRDNSGTFEASAGSVARIRLYNGALTASQVAALSRLP